MLGYLSLLGTKFVLVPANVPLAIVIFVAGTPSNSDNEGTNALFNDSYELGTNLVQPSETSTRSATVVSTNASASSYTFPHSLHV